MADPDNRQLPSQQPGSATAHGGVVFLDGPHGAVATLTPEAAAVTGKNLYIAACLAAVQRGPAPDNDPVPPGSVGREDS
jgi:hypothetical protein